MDDCDDLNDKYNRKNELIGEVKKKKKETEQQIQAVENQLNPKIEEALDKAQNALNSVVFMDEGLLDDNQIQAQKKLKDKYNDKMN